MTPAFHSSPINLRNKKMNNKKLKQINLYLIYNLFGFRRSQLYFSNVFYYYYYIPTTCFGPYGPSSGGIYILVTSQGAIFLQRIRCSCFRYQMYIYFLVFCFGDFSPLPICMWWIRLLYIFHLKMAHRGRNM
jgi:hypothetical protein